MTTIEDVPLDGMPEAPLVDLGAAVAPDPAPHGVTRSGQPRKKPGPKGPRGPGGRFAPKATPGAAGAKKATKASSATVTDYRPAVAGVLGQLFGGLAVGGLLRGNGAMIADAAVGDQLTPVIADLAHQAANQWAVVGVLLDKFLPMAEHTGAAVAIVAGVGQVLVNHGKLPAGLVPGTVTPDQLVSQFLARKAAEDQSFADIVAFAHSRVSETAHSRVSETTKAA